MDTEADAIVTKPPETDENGFPMLGGYPYNHRMRAEALVEDKVETDPMAIVPPSLIAETAERLEAEAQAEPESTPTEPEPAPADRTPAAPASEPAPAAEPVEQPASAPDAHTES